MSYTTKFIFAEDRDFNEALIFVKNYTYISNKYNKTLILHETFMRDESKFNYDDFIENYHCKMVWRLKSSANTGRIYQRESYEDI